MLAKKMVSLLVSALMMVSLFQISFVTTVIASNTTYYVSSSAGNDSYDGLAGSYDGVHGPWKTLAKASRTYQPGDKLFLKSGDTWNEQLTISGTSTSANYIEISSYSTGNKPKIQRSDPKKDTCIYLQDCSGIKITNLELSGPAQYGILAKFTKNTTGYKDFYIENCYLHEFNTFNFPGIAGDAIHFTTNNPTPLGNVVRNIIINNNEFKNNFMPFNCNGYRAGDIEEIIFSNNYVWGEDGQLSSGLFPTAAKNVYVNSNTFFNIGGNVTCGVASAGQQEAYNVFVENNEFAYTRVENSVPDGAGYDFEGNNFGSYFRSNLVHHSDGDGLMLFENGGVPYCQGNFVESNIFYYNAQNPTYPTYNCEIWIGDGNPSVVNSNTLKNNVYYKKTGVNTYNGSTSDFAVINELEIDIDSETNGTNYALSATATASSQYSSTYSAEKANDNNESTMWKSASGTSNDQWIQLDFGSTQTINKFQIMEDSGSSINRYRIEVWDSANSVWKGVFHGKTIGTMYMPVIPVTAQKVRLYVTSTTNGEPAIKEFRVYNVARSSFVEPSQDSCTNLTGQWKFDENTGDFAHDTSSLHHDGQLKNATWTTGKYGSALSFNGTSGNCVQMAYIDVNPGITFTMSTWIKASQNRQTPRTILSKGQAEAGNFQTYLNTSGEFCFYSFDIGDYSSGTVVDDNNWHHIVVTYNGQTLRMYVDKTLKLDTSASGVIKSIYKMFKVGCNTDGTHSFSGVIDDIRIFNRVLGQSEIDNLYDGNNPTPSPTPTPTPTPTPVFGLKGWWKLDEGSGTSTADSSGSGYNGTIVGSPAWVSGKSGYALGFDGTSGKYVDIQNADINIGGYFTISTWVKHPQDRSNYRVILSKGPKNAGHFEVYEDNGTGKIMFCSEEIADFQGNKAIDSGFTVDDDKWHYVAVTYDGYKIKFYKDGGLEKSISVPARETITDEIQTFRIGSLIDNTLPYKGAIDDVKIYNYVLSDLEIQDTEIKGWWKLDEGSGTSAADSSGSGNNGTIVGSPDWVSGISGYALSFDGTSGKYVNVSDTNINIGSNFTISAWVKHSQDRSNYRLILAKGPKDTGHFEVYEENGTGIIKFYSNDIGDITSGFTVDDNFWHSITITYDGSNMRFYKDGILQNTVSVTGTITDETETFRIGSLIDSTLPYIGIIDDVKVYSYKLSDTGVLYLYERLKEKKIIGWWKLDEGSGTSVADSSEYGYSGTITGSPLWISGESGHALSFDGASGKYVDISSVNVNIRNKFTISVWVRHSQDRSNYRAILAKGSKNAGHFELFEETGTGKVKLYVEGIVDSVGNSTFDSGFTVDDNKWHHVAVTCDGNNITFYKDTAQQWGIAAYGAVSDENEIVRIGLLLDNTFPYKGIIDDVKIYNYSLDIRGIEDLYGGYSGLIGLWNLDEGSGTTAADSSGLAHNGTVTGLPTWVSGRSGYALSFDGASGKYVDIQNADVNIGHDFTISAWVKAQQDRSTYHIILAKGPKNSGHYELNINTGGYLQFYSNDIGVLDSSITVDDDSWHHVLVTYNGSTLEMYIDNTLRGSSSLSGNVLDETEAIRLGTLVDGTFPFKGVLDGVRIYNRALTTTEISNLYGNGN